MGHHFDKYVERRETDSLKWDYTQERFGRSDILPLWVADMDFKSPPPLIEAVKKRADHGVFGYTMPSARLNRLIVSWLERRQNWRVDSDWIIHSPGVVTSVNAAILAFTEPGDGVLMQTPIYYPFYSSIKSNGRVLVGNSLKKAEGSYGMDFEDLEVKLSSGVKLMILCSPHNPIGRVWSRDDLAKVSALCKRYGVILLSDEIHSDLVFPGRTHIPVASLDKDAADLSLTLLSPTKTFNMAGLSESYAVIPDRVLRAKFKSSLSRCGADVLNLFGLVAAEAAYESCEGWLEELLAYLEGNLNFLMDYFAEEIPRIKPVRPEATYLAWLDCTSLNVEGNIKDFFTENARVGLNDGAAFGEEGRDFVRINFACPRSLLEEGLDRIRRAVDKL